MMSSIISQENPTRKTAQGPGGRLQAARTEQGLSLEDIATSMHLSVGIVEAIEDNNFDDITAPIFVKGYLRAYARIVSLDEDELIQQYLDYYSDEDPPIHPTTNVVPQISSDDARIKWTTYLVIIGLVGLLAAWWWNQYQIKTDVVSLDAQQIDSVQKTEPDREIVADKTETSSDVPTSLPGETDVSSEAVDEPEKIAITAVEEAPEIDNPEVPSPEIENINQEEVDQQVVEVVDFEVRSGETSRMAPMGTEQLQIIIHADTWVDIEDANGHRLVYELLRADQKLDLTGKAPFVVFLGNGHGVELIYNNETVDITHRIRDNNTARLRIGS